MKVTTHPGSRSFSLSSLWYLGLLLSCLGLATCASGSRGGTTLNGGTGTNGRVVYPERTEVGSLPPADLEEVIPVSDYTPTIYRPYIRRAEVAGPSLPKAQNQCFMAAEVINYDGVDGCGLLLETDEGNLFLVGAVPRGEPLEAGTRISFGFEYMTDFSGESCPNVDAVIRILCKRLLRVSSGVPRPVLCESYDRPSQWLVDLAQYNSATYITRFPWTDGRFVYLLETPNGQYLYDCRGYLICKPRRNCLSFIEDYSAGELIWEG